MKVIKPSYEILPFSEDIGYAQRIEQAGRVCYKSEDKITTESAVPFVQSLIRRGHESVLEHARITILLIPDYARLLLENLHKVHLKSGLPCYLTFIQSSEENILLTGNIRAWRDTMLSLQRHTDFLGFLQYVANADQTLFPEFAKPGGPVIPFENPETYRGTSMYGHIRDISVRFICDRAIANELVRHRAASFSQESTRYCNYGNGKFGRELTVIEPCFFDRGDDSFVYWYNGCYQAEKHYFHLLERGTTPQEARDVLPLSLKTELIMTATLSQWKEIFTLRTAPAAHPQMRELMIPLKEEFQERWPDIF